MGVANSRWIGLTTCGAGLWPLEPLNPPWTSSLVIDSILVAKECEGNYPCTKQEPHRPPQCIVYNVCTYWVCMSRQAVRLGVNHIDMYRIDSVSHAHIDYVTQPMPRIPVPKGVGPCCKAWGTSWKPSTHTTPRLRNRECQGSTTYWDVPLATDSRPR